MKMVVIESTTLCHLLEVSRWSLYSKKIKQQQADCCSIEKVITTTCLSISSSSFPIRSTTKQTHFLVIS